MHIMQLLYLQVIVLNTKSKIIHRVFFRTYLLIIWKSETHYHHKNFSECFYNTIKSLYNEILDCMSSPDYMWLTSIIYMWLLLNHTHAAGINGIPITNPTVYNVDIIPLLCFRFRQLVYYNIDVSNFSSEPLKIWTMV